MISLMKKVGIVLGGLFLLLFVGVIVVAGYYMTTRNRFVTLNEGVDASWGEVQNQFQRRAELVPNLVNTVQGAANFEKSTITEVTQARAAVNNIKLDPTKAPTSPEQLQQFQAAQDALGSALSRLLVVVERYPELKATQNFQNLQAQLEGTENRIAVARGRFNDITREYNTAIKRVPASIIAGMSGFQPKPYFQAAAGSEKAPEVKFNFGSQPGATNP